MAFVGATNGEIAEYLGVSENTITAWAKAHPEFSEALDERRRADDEVVRSLYLRAVGQTVTEKSTQTTPIMVRGAKVADLTKTTITEKVVLGSEKAQMFWLTNRRPDQWKNRQDVTQTVDHDLAERLLEARKAKRERQGNSE